jgi:hypothetical protein
MYKNDKYYLLHKKLQIPIFIILDRDTDYIFLVFIAFAKKLKNQPKIKK